MENFIINLQQINIVLQTLGEFPAKQVISSVDILRNLPKFVEPEKDAPKE